MIEQGRYPNPKLSTEHRFCPKCFRNGTEPVEDEFHLICDLPAYNDLRENLFETVNITKCKLTHQASSLLAKHIASRRGGRVRWTPTRDFRYA